jgi:alcohol dehydrogenase/propanol-preferring alcohol dehydrogenase
MRAWAVVENGAPLREIEIPTPEPTGTQVLVEVTHCGVCHSDLHNWDGYYDLGGGKRITLKDRGISLPIVLGHEIVGKVVQFGSEAEDVAVGNTRIVYPWVGCGKCTMCLQEEDNMCPTPRAIGVFQNGGYGTHVMVPHPRHLFDPGKVDLALAATYSCSGITAYSAIRKVMPMPADEPLVIVGAGGVGLNAIAVLKAMQHENIVVVDIGSEKRAAALAAGATTVVDGAGDGVTQRILVAAGGHVAAVIDFVNGSSTARSAFDALRKGGKLIQVGLFGGELTVPLPTMALRVLTLRGSYVGSPKELRELLMLAQNGSLHPMPISKMPKSKVNSALSNLRDGKTVGRVVLIS